VLADLLALSASFIWGGSNIMAGLESRRRSAWTVSALSQIAAALGAGAALLIAGQRPPDFWHALAPLLGGAVGGLGTIAFYFALARGAMSLVSPIVAAQVVVPLSVGLLRGERPGIVAYLGMACAVGGVLLVSGTRRHHRDRTAGSVILLAICAALCWGIMLVGFNIGGTESVYWSVFDARIAAAAVVLIVFVLSGRRLELAGEKLPVLLVLASIGLLMALANVVFTVASTLGYLSVGAILGSLSPLLTTAYGQLRLDERLSACQWCGAATVLLGVVLLAL
jgi:drug/metabolite transporter (DMT)-like permease